MPPGRHDGRGGPGGFAVVGGMERESTRQSIPGPATRAEPWRKITDAGMKHSLKERVVILIPLIRWAVKKLRALREENIKARQQVRSR